MKRVLIFFACLLLCAGIAWLGGYDFNQRSPWVAWYTGLAIWIGAIATVLFGE